jgi:hypothetical protein
MLKESVLFRRVTLIPPGEILLLNLCSVTDPKTVSVSIFGTTGGSTIGGLGAGSGVGSLLVQAKKVDRLSNSVIEKSRIEIFGAFFIVQIVL